MIGTSKSSAGAKNQNLTKREEFWGVTGERGNGAPASGGVGGPRGRSPPDLVSHAAVREVEVHVTGMRLAALAHEVEQSALPLRARHGRL